MESEAAIGQQIINAIVSGKLFRVERCGDSELIIWAANSDEQIGRLAVDLSTIVMLSRAECDDS